MADEPAGLPQSLTTALQQMVEALDRLGIRYALIGGVATSFRSRPRFTRDLDFVLDVPQLALRVLLTDLSARGFSFDSSTVIHEWNQDHLTALSYKGVRIDWLKPVLPCYQRVVDCAIPEQVLGSSIRIAAPEGLIVLKLIAFREQDQLDIQNLLAANRGKLDLSLIRREWQAISDAHDPRSQRFEELVKHYYDLPADR